MITLNCATGTIVPYVPSADMPWNKERAMHLFRRMGYGATTAQIEAALQLDPQDIIDTLIDQALNLPLTEEPEWATWNVNDYTDFDAQREEQYIEFLVTWVKELLNDGFREKMTLFWHNHFVTKLESYLCPSWLFEYRKVLQSNALGNFKTLTHAIGTTPAMLVFLNGIQSTNIEPNENYARELYELFTLGQDNSYTQEDIEETARALTGWNGFVALCAPVGYLSISHDNGQKTIFGQTGNWGYDDVHDILFSERADQVATYICTKLYTHFVHPEVDESIVEELATTFKDNNFELVPVLRQLFKSEHFFDEAIIGAQIKSPVDVLLSFCNESSLLQNDEIVEILGYFVFMLGQQLASPPDVAGWPGNRSWINNDTLTARWQSVEQYVYYNYEAAPDLLVQLGQNLSGPFENDPALVTQIIVDHFIPNGLNTPEAYERAADVFKWEVPQNYYDDGTWNMSWETIPAQVALLLGHIVRLPEFQMY